MCEIGDLAIAITSNGPTLEADRCLDFEVRPGEPATVCVNAARRSALIVVPPTVAAAEAAGTSSWGYPSALTHAAFVQPRSPSATPTHSPTKKPGGRAESE